jgi:phytoene dehydrogenase-like protein
MRRARALSTVAARPSHRSYDVVIIGGGHNALVAAAYLSRAGRRVCVLERRPLLGGAAVTEEVIPGFKFSRASYVYSLFRPQIVADLELHRHGLQLLRRVPSSFTPTPRDGGPSLLLGEDAASDAAEIRKFSKADARAYAEYNALLERYSAALRPLLDVAPPDLGALWPPPLRGRTAQARWWRNVRDALFYARHLLGLGASLPGFLELLAAPAAKLLHRFFETPILKATLATDAVVGAMVAPSTPGSAYVLLYHVMAGAWYGVRGGMGALSGAVAAAAREAGAELLPGAPVARILVERGRAVGVALEGGVEVRAPVVLSTAAPTLTLGPLLGAEGRALLPPRLAAALRGVGVVSGSVKINLALSALPNFRCKPNPRGQEAVPQPWHRGTIHFEEDMEQLEAAFRDAAAGAPSSRPMVEMTLPSVLDDSLAPPGKHVCLLFVQYAPYELPGAGGWDAPGARAAFAARVYKVIEEHAPGFTASIIGEDILTPVDLERVFALPRGNICHASMTVDQIAFLRPAEGVARYATPVPGLYLGGAGTHPGGGVMGAAGRNAAREVMEDFKEEWAREALAEKRAPKN